MSKVFGLGEPNCDCSGEHWTGLRHSLSCPASGERPRHPLDTLSVHDLSALRRIIGEVIDGGVHSDGGTPWGTHDGFGGYLDGEDARSQREQFISVVEQRIIATAAPSVGGEQ